MAEVYGTLTYDVSMKLDCKRSEALSKAEEKLSNFNIGDKLVVYDYDGNVVGEIDVHNVNVAWNVAVDDGEVL